jgi:hypothetical protein
MTVSKYLDEFTQLSHYAPYEVNTDAKRQERFLDGLIGPLNYHLQSHTFPNFQMLLNKAICLENKRKELREQKRKFQSQGQSSSNPRPRYNSSQDSQFRSSVQDRNHGQSQQYHRSFEEPEESNPMTPQAPNPHQNLSGAPVRNNTPVHRSRCFNCGELGHYASIYPQRNMQTPQRDNRSQENYMHGRLNHVTAEEAQGDKDLVLGTFLINSVPATVLFDSGASHLFITERFVSKHDVPRSSMKTHLLISSPNGEMKSTYVCPQVNLKIGEIDFQVDLVIITSSGIDVILGMDWLGKHDGIILCAKKSVLLTSPKGDRIEFVSTASPKKKEK